MLTATGLRGRGGPRNGLSGPVALTRATPVSRVRQGRSPHETRKPPRNQLTWLPCRPNLSFRGASRCCPSGERTLDRFKRVAPVALGSVLLVITFAARSSAWFQATPFIACPEESGAENCKSGSLLGLSVTRNRGTAELAKEAALAAFNSSLKSQAEGMSPPFGCYWGCHWEPCPSSVTVTSGDPEVFVSPGASGGFDATAWATNITFDYCCSVCP